jgi:hypothetical protein
MVCHERKNKMKKITMRKINYYAYEFYWRIRSFIVLNYIDVKYYWLEKIFIDLKYSLLYSKYISENLKNKIRNIHYPI